MRNFPAVIPVCLVVIACSLSSPVAADTLYRCKGKQGESAYTTERAGYTDCKAIRDYEAPKPAAAQPASADQTSSADKPTVSFRSAAPGEKLETPPKAKGARVTRGAVYRWEKDGITHYTNKSPPRSAGAKLLFSYIETCYACGEAAGIDWQQVPLNRTAFAAEVTTAAQMAKVDPSLVRAIMHAESAFDPNAISKVGAQGLMQLMPDTAKRFGVADAFVPAQNIAGGSQYLAWLMQRYDNNVERVAAAYNAGEGAVDRHDGVPPYEETQRFVERVGILYRRYRDAGAAAAASTATTASGG